MKATSISKLVFCLCLIACTSKVYKSDIDDCETLAWNRDHKIQPTRKLKKQRHSQSLLQAKARVKNSPAVSLNSFITEPEQKDTAITLQNAIEVVTSKDNEVVTLPGISQKKIKEPEAINCEEAKQSNELGNYDQRIQPIVPPTTYLPFLGMLGASVLLSLSVLSLFTNKVMQLSAWAARHPRATKRILVGAHVASSLGSLYLGSYFASQGMVLPAGFMAGALTVSALSALSYSKHSLSLANYRHDYIRHKLHDVVLFTGGVAMSLYVGNQFSEPPAMNVQQASYQSYSTKSEVVRASFANYKNQHAAPVDTPRKKSNGKIGITIFVSVLYAVLALFIAGLSCAISCSGAGALAAFVLIVGEVGLIFAFAAVLRGIKRNFKRRKDPDSDVGTAGSYI